MAGEVFLNRHDIKFWLVFRFSNPFDNFRLPVSLVRALPTNNLLE